MVDPQGFDNFGNPQGKQFELGAVDDHLMQGERILLYVSSQGDAERNYDWHQAKNAVAERNIKMDIALSPRGSACTLTEEQLDSYTQLWYVSDQQRWLSDAQLGWIKSFVEAGNGILIWADNEPYYADANLLARALIGTQFSGNEMGSKILELGAELRNGVFIEHPLTRGINSLFEGITISSIAPSKDLTILARSHDGQNCMACFEEGKRRIVLDTAFTKLSPGSFTKTAGTSRYFRNIAFWLARGGRERVYKTFTPGRESLAKINPGGQSERYKHSISKPTKLSWVLHWEGGATLGLTITGPDGTILMDRTATNPPLRAEITTDTPGNYICWITGVSVPNADFPYVLNLVEEKWTAPQDNQLLPSRPRNTFRIYLVVDMPALGGGKQKLVEDELKVFAERLRNISVKSISVVVAAARIAGVQDLVQILPGLISTLSEQQVQSNVVRPLVVLFLPADISGLVPENGSTLRRMAQDKKVNVIPIAIGVGSGARLNELTTGPVLSMSDTSLDAIDRVFNWVADLAYNMIKASEEGKVQRIAAPPLPDELRIMQAL